MAMFITCRKQRTINHLIIFNDSISKIHQCSIWCSWRDISMFLTIHIGKKKFDVIQFLGMLKKYIPKNKTNFCLKEKAMLCFIKKLFLTFTQFSSLISSCRSYTDHLLSTYVRILFSYFFYSLISVSKKQQKKTMLALPYP